MEALGDLEVWQVMLVVAWNGLEGLAGKVGS